MDCKRKGQFPLNEFHDCFKYGCMSRVYPAKSETCPICNFKKCKLGHCGCDLTKEARFAVKILYQTYCTYCVSEVGG